MLQFSYGKVSLPRFLCFFGGPGRQPIHGFSTQQAATCSQPASGQHRQADGVPGTASCTGHHDAAVQPFLSRGDVTSAP